jgi:hypothetical protein
VLEAAPDHDDSPLTILLWSLFLGMSWTWCIGMFLPVILVREFGLAGWIVFAVPNVLGAAAMGWVLRTRESSTRITEHHFTACVAFSLVTIAFHLFFLTWFVGRLLPGWGPIALLVFLYPPLVGLRTRPDSDLLSSAFVFLLSVLCIAFAVNYAGTHDIPSISPPSSHWADAPRLSTVCTFGFALCPYLDMTFHRARQSLASQHRARLAFSVGFGLFFALMIVFTLWYAPYAATPVRTPGALPTAFAAIIAVHMLAQSTLTLTFHCRHVSPRHLLLVVFSLSSILIGASVSKPRQWLSLDAGELIYRCFMGFYALVFPAYVWLCIIPGRGAAPPTKRHLLVFASAVLIALPMFWIGFIHQRLIWLLPGLLVVLLARLAVRSPRAIMSS